MPSTPDSPPVSQADQANIAEKLDYILEFIRNGTGEQIMDIVEAGIHDFNKMLAERETALPNEALIALAQNKYIEIRKLIAQREQNCTEALTILAQDKSEKVRELVASRQQDLPYEALKVLAQDNFDIRRIIAKRKQELPEDVLHLLIKKYDHDIHLDQTDILFLVAKRKQKLPQSILDIVAKKIPSHTA